MLIKLCVTFIVISTIIGNKGNREEKCKKQRLNDASLMNFTREETCRYECMVQTMNMQTFRECEKKAR
jgi:hypothetical protein